MITTLLHLLRLCSFLCGSHRNLALENLTMRQELAVYKRSRVAFAAATEVGLPLNVLP